MAGMVASAATGAGLELAFGMLLKSVLQLKKDNATFKSTLNALAHTIESLGPDIKRIDAFNRHFDRVHEIDMLKEIIEKGVILVEKCKKVNTYNILLKPFYVWKLNKLDENLRRYIGTDMQVQQTADIKETLFEVKRLNTRCSCFSMSSSTNGGGTVKSSFGLVGGCSPPALKVDPVGFEIPIKDLRKFLIDADLQSTAPQSVNKTPLMVVSAPGGCGMTTLALALCHDTQVRGKFNDNIFYFTVSKQADLLVIIQRLFHHHGYGVPDFQNEEDALNQLEVFLKSREQVPTLLVLDDVWDGSEFLIEKLAFRINNYKILVTSRYEFPTFGSTYKLQTLNDADAMTLFRKEACPPGGNSYVPDQDDLEKFVKCFRGFPLVISVIAKSLCRKPAAEWRKMMNHCSKVSFILSNSNILKCLQTSVDALDEKMKECFKDLGSFPEDHKIPAAALIDMWMELHKLDLDSAILNLHELSNRNLLDIISKRKIAGEDDGIYNEHFITQHDLLRELAIQLSDSGSTEARKRLFIDTATILECQNEQKHLHIHASLLSICTDETFSSIWCSLEAPEVEVLALNFYANNNYTLPEFMQSMTKLKVLLILNSDFFPSDLSNSSILGSLRNLKRLRLEKVSIPPDLFSSVQLRNLKKISLVMCNVDPAFSSVETDISDTMPNLEEINIDYCNDLVALPAGFCNLLQLKWLSITNCHKLSRLPDDVGKLLNVEVLRLNSCTELSELPEKIGKLRMLHILDLSDCLSLTALPEQFGELSGLRKLYMIDCPNCKLPDAAMNLTNLEEVIGDEETTNSWKLFQPYLTNLKTTVHKDVNLNWL